MVLGFAELREEHQPPEHIWLNDERLADHFERVRESMKDPNARGMEPIPDWEQNELTKDIKRK